MQTLTGLRFPSSYKLVLSSLIAWCAAMSVDVYQINHGSGTLLLGYLLNLVIWLLALALPIHRKRLLKTISLFGLVSVVVLSANPKTLLAPVILTFWMSYLPSLISEKQTWLVYIAVNCTLIGLLAMTQAEPQYLITTMSFTAFQLFAISSALQRIELSKQKSVIEKTNIDLISAQSLLLQKSKTDERQRISRNLHDSIGQQLTSLSLQTEHALQTQSYKSEVDFSNYLKATKRDLREALNTLRKTVKQFKENDTPNLEVIMRLIASKIPNLEFEFSSSITITHVGLTEDLIYCCQEGLSNALRHGRADKIWINIFQQDGEVLVRLGDNGHSPVSLEPQAPNSGNGLEGMAHRLKAYSASLRLTKNDTQGSCLEITIPAQECFSEDFQ